MSHPEADSTRCASSGGEMTKRHSDLIANKAPILVIAALALGLGACSAGTNCAMFELQCGTPTAEQESKVAAAAAADVVAKQEDAKLVKDGHYGTPYGPGPQYGEAGGDQYGYGPAYSYARQAPPGNPDSPGNSEHQ
jgi:hypothetical protein